MVSAIECIKKHEEDLAQFDIKDESTTLPTLIGSKIFKSD